MIIRTFIFSLICILCAFILINKFEKAQVATYVVLIAWGPYLRYCTFSSFMDRRGH